MSALSRFSIRELQDCVGEELLEDLNALLPLVEPDFVDGSHYNSKQLLEKIFIAFGGAEQLRDAGFRATLLNHLETSELVRIAAAIGIAVPAGSPFERVASDVSREGWKSPDSCLALLRELGLPESLAPKPSTAAPGHMIQPEPAHRYLPLLEYQSSVYFAALRLLEIPLSRFVIQMPTGSGKTRTAMEIIAWLVATRGCDVVWLAHSGELCSQAAQGFKDVWSHVGNRPVHLIRHFGSSAIKGSLPLNSDPVVTITSFQQLQRKVDSPDASLPTFFRKDRIELVVVDEAHKVVAPTYQKVTKALIGGATACIGLTATPGRSVIDLDENKELANFFFQKIVSFDAKGEDPIRYLRSRRVLAHADYVPLNTNITYTLSAKEKAEAERFLDLPSGFLNRVGGDFIRNAEIVKRLKMLCQEGRQILFFACSVAHSRFICSVLSYLGIAAGHIDGTTPSQSRGNLIEQFRTSNIKVLCNFEVLSTGFDAPRTDVVFISRPTASLVLYSQMIGRGLRGPLVGGTESCIIVDVKDNIIGYSDTAATYRYFEEYWTQ